VCAPAATLVDGSALAITGMIKNINMSIGHFKFKETFLVVDVEHLGVVLGMTISFGKI
jgi:hypothetical protein